MHVCRRTFSWSNLFSNTPLCAPQKYIYSLETDQLNSIIRNYIRWKISIQNFRQEYDHSAPSVGLSMHSIYV